MRITNKAIFSSPYLFSVCDERVPDVLILVVDVRVDGSHDDPGEEHKHDDLPDDFTDHGAQLGVQVAFTTGGIYLSLVRALGTQQNT